MFSRRPTAEIASGYQDRSVAVWLAVEHEIGAFIAVWFVPPVVEEGAAIAGALDALQELLRDDLVGVNIGPIERYYHAVLGAKRPHADASTDATRRTSTKCPCSAAAAAIAGETRC